jgi:hypothetical protein
VLRSSQRRPTNQLRLGHPTARSICLGGVLAEVLPEIGVPTLLTAWSTKAEPPLSMTG